ncbi:hypothetical protein OESDEN_09439 [Oesophagostomum dentatum]|uniref:Uncharacterized protein n=1 Tax=Oesophagostomum dentatum TaxID=61180 RepID=A0A0B1T5R3_OESDE|nr:hypothetical protein OESDEN_09439 [Oesophagostomum dentatum]
MGEAYRQGRLVMLYPRAHFTQPNTLSFLTAFVIRVVVAVEKELTKNNVSPLPPIEVFSANALKIAVDQIKESEYWTGTKSNSKTVSHLKAADQIVNRIYDRRPLKIKRNATDRVTSILMWEMGKHQDAMLMMELSLPHLFDPTAGTGVPVEYPRFVHDDGDKSLPYTSSAGVMLTLTKDGETRAVMAASASGSEGTVQGVADAILTMIYHRTAGKAVESKHVYLDLSDGRIHCSDFGNKHFMKWYGTGCDLVDDPKPDRKIMAMLLDQDDYDFALMAMTQEDDDYNYAVGY